MLGTVLGSTDVQRIRKYKIIPTLQSSYFYYIYILPLQKGIRNARDLYYLIIKEHNSPEESKIITDCTYLSGGSLGLRPQDKPGSFSEAKKSYMQIHVIKGDWWANSNMSGVLC